LGSKSMIFDGTENTAPPRMSPLGRGDDCAGGRGASSATATATASGRGSAKLSAVYRPPPSALARSRGGVCKNNSRRGGDGEGGSTTSLATTNATASAAGVGLAPPLPGDKTESALLGCTVATSFPLRLRERLAAKQQSRQQHSSKQRSPIPPPIAAPRIAARESRPETLMSVNRKIGKHTTPDSLTKSCDARTPRTRVREYARKRGYVALGARLDANARRISCARCARHADSPKGTAAVTTIITA
jgi:hypothetical protein